MNADKDIATIIDDLVTTDVGGRQTIYPITDALRDQTEHDPPQRAARALADAVDPGDTVLLLTGFLIPPTLVPETDGPPGAVSLARAVDAGLDANAVIACEPKAREICAATATAGELSVVDRETARESEQTVAVEEFPADRDSAKEYVDSVLSDLDPAAVVAVEKVAPNEAGIYHNMAGYDISEETAKVDELYDALDEDVLTVAVGDAGNEVGMGNVADTVREEIEYGAECQCLCGAGIAADIKVDVLVPATVSNWGGHAITACLSAIVGEPLLHDPEVERRMLLEASMAGSIDGIGGGTNGWCDGMPPSAHESILRLVHEVLSSSVHERGGGELAR